MIADIVSEAAYLVVGDHRHSFKLTGTRNEPDLNLAFKTPMKHSGRPVFLALGAEGKEDNYIEQVTEELIVIRKLISTRELTERLECQTFDRFRHQHMSEIQLLFNRCSFIHFAGHGGEGNINAQDTKFSAQSLGELFKKPGSNKIRFVFLNACDTAIMITPFHKAGIDHIIATTAGINDNLARQFAENFYTAFFYLGKSFKDSFDHAKALVPEEAEVEVEQKIRNRGLAFKWRKISRKKLWGLYSRKDAEDFSLDDIVPPKQELNQMPEARIIPIEQFVSKINREKQDNFLIRRIQSGGSLQNAYPIVLAGGWEHYPILYFTRLHDKYNYTILDYQFPDSSPITTEDIFFSLKNSFEKQQGSWTEDKNNLIDLLASVKDKIVIVYTYYLLLNSPNSEVREVIELHKKFWREVKVSGKQIIAILVLTTKSRSDGNTLIDEETDPSNDYMPTLQTIHDFDLDQWKAGRAPEQEQLFTILAKYDYREKIVAMSPPPENGFYLRDIFQAVDTTLRTHLKV